MLIKCKDSTEVLKTIKQLSCVGCFETESLKSLASDDFETAFSQYQNRWKFEHLDKTYQKNGLEYERGVNLWFTKCSYCGKVHCLSLNSDEISEDLFKSLNLFASKNDGEI